MNTIYIIAGIIIGGGIAWLLNKFFANKIEHKGWRIGIKASAYVVCIIVCMVFSALGSSVRLLDTFITDRIGFMERKLVEAFPDSGILEKNFNANELERIIGELKQTVNSVDTSGDSYLESLAYSALLSKLNGYVNTIESGAGIITSAGDENGTVTVKSVLFSIKDASLKTVARYFVYGQIGILILLIVFVGIYIGVVRFIKKGGATYNKSIIYGDAQ